jgi:hypothetical protein
MDYIITDGKHFISSKSGIKAVDHINKAGKFDIDKANNVLKSIPKALKIFEWRCIPYNESEAILKEKDKPMKSLDEYTGLTENILDKMLNREEYIKDLQSYMKTIDDQLSVINMEIIDIEHAAEFYDLDLFKGWKLYKMLQNARKRRRKLKDERLKIDYILSRNFVDCTNNAISNYIKSLENRKYEPRVLKELFNL